MNPRLPRPKYSIGASFRSSCMGCVGPPELREGILVRETGVWSTAFSAVRNNMVFAPPVWRK